MSWLVLIHVLSAIIGVGPAFFGHVLSRRTQNVEELRHSIRISAMLEYFPKIGGTIAVLTGILLIVIGNYGSVLQTWLIGSLILYVMIQVTVIGFVVPRQKKLKKWLDDPENVHATQLSDEQQKNLASMSNLYYLASALGALLFIFMILKPQ